MAPTTGPAYRPSTSARPWEPANRPALTFLGAAGTVTGSKFLLETAEARVLLDCGLYQGLSSLRRRNWAPPAADLSELDAIVLTHAHLDHTGYLPLLARNGWDGPVYATEGTARLAEIVLTDSAHLQEEEAEHANSHGWSKHRPALPLYDTADARRALQLLRVAPLGESVDLATGLELVFGRAGHILGSAWAQVAVDGPVRPPDRSHQRGPRPARSPAAAASHAAARRRHVAPRVDLRQSAA